MNAQPEAGFMQRAFDLARQGEGRTAPNPPVGAVVVRDGRIVGEGFHPAAGQPHAEVLALRQAGSAARGATLYVTLEPCNHTGRTGPCTEAIIGAGIAKVVAAIADPNPKVAGEGFQRLRDAGVTVDVGLLAEPARQLLAPFAKHILTGLPYVTLKAALTLDGQLATSSGQSQWITGPESRALAHRLRDRHDAIMVGSGTVLADNPRLTTRLPQGEGRDPLRIVVDSQLRTPLNAAVLTGASPAATLIATTEQAPYAAEERLRAAGAEVLRVPGAGPRVDLAALLQLLGRRGLLAILLEGGGHLNHAAWQAGLVDRAVFCLAPLLLGGQGIGVFAGPGPLTLAAARRLGAVQVERLGEDVMITGEVLPCSPD